MNTVPPLWQEWLDLLTLLTAGLVCWWIGREASRRSNRASTLAAASGAMLAIGGAAAHYPPLRDLAGPWLVLPGGEAALACLGTLLLLGVAGAERKGRPRRPLLALATGLVFLLLTALGSGSLGWRYFGRSLYTNFPDKSGALRQTTGITCGPAAAAMLLHRAGIRVSEGELASLANTTPLQGTTLHALARAVGRVAGRHGQRVRIRRVDDAAGASIGVPFVAFVTRPGVGRHAVCVLRAELSGVETIDPLSGSTATMSREAFIAEWDPTVIWIELQPSQDDGQKVE